MIPIGKLLECEIAETCLPPVALPKAHQTNVSSNSAYSDWANVWNRRRLDSFPTDSLGGSRASSNSGLKKLGGPGAGLGRWAKSWKAEKAAKLIVAEVETR